MLVQVKLNHGFVVCFKICPFIWLVLLMLLQLQPVWGTFLYESYDLVLYFSLLLVTTLTLHFDLTSVLCINKFKASSFMFIFVDFNLHKYLCFPDILVWYFPGCLTVCIHIRNSILFIFMILTDYCYICKVTDFYMFIFFFWPLSETLLFILLLFLLILLDYLSKQWNHLPF